MSFEWTTARRPSNGSSPIPLGTPALLLRKCACGVSPGAASKCTECRKEQLSVRRKVNGSGGHSTAPPIVHEVLRSPGQPLDGKTLDFMESRFGHDFSRVRVHSEHRAGESANAVDATAYTVGSHIVFGQGQYQPTTQAGRILLAHELTHVVQQRFVSLGLEDLAIAPAEHPNEEVAEQIGRGIVEAGGSKIPLVPGPTYLARSVLQRFTFGKNPPAGKVIVPADHQDRVTSAMNILSRMTEERRCKKFFKENCTAGLGAEELATAMADAEIYHIPSEGKGFGASTARAVAADPRQIAYNLTAYRVGRWELASTLLHEMFHTCVLGKLAEEEVTAENAVEVCRLYTPFILSISPKSGPVGTIVTIRGFEFGPKQTAEDRVKFSGVDAGVADEWKLLGGGISTASIVVRVPAAAKTGPVTVENNGIPSNEVTFTVT